MAPKQRQVRVEQRGGLEAIQALEQRTDEELEAETKYKAAALAILGARASERFDAEAARGYFQRAIAAARPQERMQLRRMADASLALAERRAGDLKDAVQRLGQAPPSSRQLFALRAMGLLIPTASKGILARVRGILLIILLIAVLLALGLGIVELISLPFGGLGVAPGILLGLIPGARGARDHRRDRTTAARPRTQSPVCLIVNPAAGGGRAGRLAPAAEQALRERGLTVRRADTRDLQHARELAAEAAGAGETVVALSGDGLIGVIADTLRAFPDAVLGVIPGGRGNDLARVLEIPDDVRARRRDRRRRAHPPRGPRPRARTSAPAADGQAFVGIASAGFDSDANRIANEAPAWLGGLVYVYGALRALAAWRPARFEIELDPPGERHQPQRLLRRRRQLEGLRWWHARCTRRDARRRPARGGRPRERRQAAFLTTDPAEGVQRSARARAAACTSSARASSRSAADRPFTMYADGDPIGELPVRVRALRGAVTMLTPRVPGADAAFSPEPQPAGAAEG